MRRSRSSSARLLARVLLALGLFASLAACDDFHARCGTIAACDIRDASCQSNAFRYAACLRARNEPTDVVPPVTVQSQADYLTAQIAQAQAQDTPALRNMRRGLALFGMSAPMSTPESEARVSYQDVDATYNSDTKSVLVVDQGYSLSSGYAVSTLVHEMVHALQDAAGELDPPTVAPRFDAQLALSAVIEGEATIAYDQTLTQGWGFSFDSLAYGKALSGYRGSTTPVFLRATDDVFDVLHEHFSYAWGASYLWPLQRDQGAAAIATAHANLPVSSAAVMQLDPSMPGQWPNDLGEQAVPVLPNLTLVGTLHLGSYAYDAFTAAFGRGSYLPWSGFLADTLSVFTSSDGTVLAAWRFRFDDPARIADTLRWLQQDNVVLSIGTDGADLWLVESENPTLVSALPTPLTFQAAPAADFEFSAGHASVRCVKHDTTLLH